MTLISLAVDYKKAPIETRSAFSLDGELLNQHLKSLIQLHGVSQVLILSTCNRTEIYVVLTELQQLDQVMNWWQLQAKRQDLNLKEYLVIRQETHVAQHLMRLACGLESMILGEPQILGQLKQAYALALSSKTLGGRINRLCQKVFSIAKNVRNFTDIGQCPVSVAFSAVTLAKQNFEDIEHKRILIVGAGETAKLVARHISTCSPQALAIANRTLEKAQALADEFLAKAYPLDAVKHIAHHYDVIITALHFNTTIINQTMLQHSDKHHTVIDLSVPTVICQNVKQLTNVTTYYVDDIHTFIEENKSLRQKAALRADKWIEKGLDEYITLEKSIESDKMITAMRRQATNMIDQELERSLRRLANGEDPKMVLARFAHGVKNKWLHTPSVSLRNAAVSGRNDILENAEEIFGLNTGKVKNERLN